MVTTSPKAVIQLPAGPRIPPTVQLMNWLGRPYPFLDDCVQRYGDLFTVRLGSLTPIVFCSNPAGNQAIFKAEPGRFDVGRTNGLLQPLVGTASILLLDGDRHQRQRQILMPPFHGERMRAYGTLIGDLTRQATADWSSQQPFAVRPVMQEISLRVILQAVFGLSQGEQYEELRLRVSRLLDMTGSPLSSSLLFIEWLQKDLGAWSPWGQFVHQRSQVDQILYREIGDRRTHLDPDRPDILTLLLLARDAEGNPMSDLELRDELMTLLLAGHETTASALAWALYWIHEHPSVRDALLTELDGVSLTEPMAIARLPYLSAVCQETLRIYPITPIAMPRLVLNEPFDLLGHAIPPETMVAPCIYLTHHREDLYPDAHQFRPERFLERQFSPYEFLPFGGGNRQCVGMAFALFEMKLVLATLLTQFSLTRVGDRPLYPTRRGVTLAPPSTLRMVATPRS
ncbi:MAG: cytochrome P450 [Elainellaceae cyanobacterium]